MALKGDLQNVQLADLFQTLSLNSQEGVLKLRENEKEYRLYFHPRGINLLNPTISGRRRLGTMVVEAGLISSGDLEQALAIQSQSGRFLGEILVEKELISRDQLDNILTRQIEEEIYHLFTLQQARFEFREGPPSGEASPLDSFFNVDGIVLEAARRLDEWSEIRKTLPDLETIYVPRDCESTPPTEASQVVFDLLDGTRSILDVSDCMLASPFETAKQFVELLAAGAIRHAESNELVGAAKAGLREGKVDKARAILHQASQRITDESASLLPVIARLFAEAGDQRASALIDLEIARLLLAQGDQDGARTQLEKALNKAPDEPTLIAELAGICRAGGDIDGEISYLEREIEALMERGHHDVALDALDRLQELEPDHELLARHYLTAAKGCRNIRKGVAFLERVLEQAGSDTDPRALINIYKQILDLDPSRVDVARRLRRMEAQRRRSKQLKWGLFVGTIVILGAGGFFGHREYLRREAIKQLAPVEAHIANQRPREARVLLAALIDRFGPGVAESEIAELHSVIQTQLSAHAEKAKRARQEVVQTRLGRVQELLDEGSMTEALASLLDAMKTVDQHAFRDILELKLSAFEAIITEQHQILSAAAREFEVPKLATEETLRSIKEQYEPIFLYSKLEDFSQLSWLAKRAVDEIDITVGQELLETIATLASEIVALFGPSRDSLRELEDRLLQLRDLADMDDEYEMARAAEARGDIALARDKYRLIIDRYGQGDLTAFFRDKLEHIVAALSRSKLIDSKIAQGKIKGAHADAFALIERFPDLHLEQSVFVPIALSLSPIDATITISEGTRHGSVLRLPCHGVVEIKAEAEGFYPKSIEFDPSSDYEIEIDLNRVSILHNELRAPIQATPAVDGSFAFIGGRDGILRKLDLVSGEELARWDAKSISGVRRPPVHRDGRVYVSVEGSVYALEATDLSRVWARPLDELNRSDLLLLEDRLVVLDQAGEFVALDLADGRVLWRTPRFSGSLGGSPVQAGGSIVAGLSSGHLIALDAKEGRELWNHRFGEGFTGSPIPLGDNFLVTTETGRVLKIDGEDGTMLASTEVGELPSANAVLAHNRIFVPTGDRVTALDPVDLSKVAEYGPGFPVSSEPCATKERLYVGGADGKLYAFDINGGPPLWRSPMGSRIMAAPVMTPLGLLVTSEDGRVELLRP